MYNSHMNITSKNDGVRVERFPSVSGAQEAAVAYLNDILAQYVDRPVLLLLAGGSSVALYDKLNPEYFSADLTVTVTDERFSNELDINNFAILQSTHFYDELIQVDAFCINTQPNHEETIEQCANRFERNIREWRKDFPKGTVIAVYGIGKDGHIGGIIPGVLPQEEFDKKFNNPEILVSHIDATGKTEYPLRFSTTIPFMKQDVDHALVFVSGPEKQEALKLALSGDSKYFELPATVIREMKDVTVFTDIQE